MGQTIKPQNTRSKNIIIELLILLLLGISFVKLLVPLINDSPILKQMVIWFFNILLLIYVFISLKLNNESWKELGLTFKPLTIKGGIKTFLTIILVTILGSGAYILSGVIITNLIGVVEPPNMSNYNYFNDNLGLFLISLIGVYIVSSFGEEVIYRAYLINRFTKVFKGSNYSKIYSLLLSSIIFGLIHYEWGLVGMVQTGFMGLAMGLAYIRLNNRLWIIVFSHAIMDSLLLFGLYMSSS